MGEDNTWIFRHLGMEWKMPYVPPLDGFLQAPVPLVIRCEYIPLFGRSFDGDSSFDQNAELPNNSKIWCLEMLRTESCDTAMSLTMVLIVEQRNA